MSRKHSLYDVTFSSEQELVITLIKEFEVQSYIKGYHVYKNEWIPFKGEVLETRKEPENSVDKYAVAVMKDCRIVGHLSKGKSGRFAKTIFYFLRSNELNSSKIIIIGKRVDLGDEDGLQVPCIIKMFWRATVH